MKGTTFELTSRTAPDIDDEESSMFWDEDRDPDQYKNPCATSFTEWKTSMIEVSEGVFKKVQKQPADDAKEVDMNRHRISYHRNMYLEGEDHPFDSTYLNGKSDEVCLPLRKDEYLEGFLEALSTMKEGEQSLFVISYKKMFKELGCPPRVSSNFSAIAKLNH
jgi:FKBP-type peptidyl-prolyl cis-trans isomerase